MRKSHARELQFNIRLSAEEKARMERVSARLGLNWASAIRFLIKCEDVAPTLALGARKRAT